MTRKDDKYFSIKLKQNEIGRIDTYFEKNHTI